MTTWLCSTCWHHVTLPDGEKPGRWSAHSLPVECTGPMPDMFKTHNGPWTREGEPELPLYDTETT